MIFYTLKGPSYNLEIHDSKIILVKKGWWRLLSFGPTNLSWEMKNLSSFQIVVPKGVLYGKLEWKSFDGKQESFRFSTNAEMVQRIEKYLQKVVLKNHERSPAPDGEAALNPAQLAVAL